MYRRFEKYKYVLSFIHCHGICVYIVFSLSIARLMRLAIILPAEVSWKRNKMKDFSQSLRSQPLWCSGWVYSRVEPKVQGSSPSALFILPFLFLPVFCVVVFYKYSIYLNNCYLIKCNKQQEKYCVSRENIVLRILNIWINNLNFYYFLQFTVGKPELITT